MAYQWIEFTRKDENGLPRTRSVKISPPMDSPVYFSTTGKAEVPQEVADFLVSTYSEIVESDSTNPGSPFPDGEDYSAQDIRYTAPDGSFDHVNAETADIDVLNLNGRDIIVGSSNPSGVKDGAFWLKSLN